MSDPRKKYGVNRAAERNGAPVVIDDHEFIMRSTAEINREYRYAIAIAAEIHRDVEGADRVRAFVNFEDKLIEAFADHVILGWRNVTNGSDAELPFTRENFITLMQDCPPLWEQIKTAAADVSRFPFASVKEDGTKLGES